MTKLEQFEATKPTRFRFIMRLSVEKTAMPNGDLSCDVELLVSEDLAKNTNLKIRFKGCTELQVGDLNPTIAASFKIYDISAHGLEMIRYRAVDEEGEYLALNCHDFEFDIN